MRKAFWPLAKRAKSRLQRALFRFTLLLAQLPVKEHPMQLKIGVRVLSDGIFIVDGAGRIIFGEETAMLRDQVKALISESGRIVLNLADVTYIDSGGLGTLVALYTTARNAGGAVKLSRLTPRVGDLLQVTKLLTVFEVYNSEDEAVLSFRKGVAA
jgi:anti-sigma B factor antagonist